MLRSTEPRTAANIMLASTERWPDRARRDPAGCLSSEVRGAADRELAAGDRALGRASGGRPPPKALGDGRRRSSRSALCALCGSRTTSSCRSPRGRRRRGRNSRRYSDLSLMRSPPSTRSTRPNAARPGSYPPRRPARRALARRAAPPARRVRRYSARRRRRGERRQRRRRPRPASSRDRIDNVLQPRGREACRWRSAAARGWLAAAAHIGLQPQGRARARRLAARSPTDEEQATLARCYTGCLEAAAAGHSLDCLLLHQRTRLTRRRRDVDRGPLADGAACAPATV